MYFFTDYIVFITDNPEFVSLKRLLFVCFFVRLSNYCFFMDDPVLFLFVFTNDFFLFTDYSMLECSHKILF